MASTVEFPVVTSIFRNGNRTDLLEINQGLFRSSSVQSNLVAQSKLTNNKQFSSQEKINGSPKLGPKRTNSPKNGLKSKSELPGIVVQPPSLQNGKTSLSGSLFTSFRTTPPRQRLQSPLARTANTTVDTRRRASGGNCLRDALGVSGQRSMTPDRGVCGTALTVKCRPFAMVSQRKKVEEVEVIINTSKLKNATPEQHGLSFPEQKNGLTVTVQNCAISSEQNGTNVDENSPVQAILSEVLHELLISAVMRVLMLDCRGFTSYNANHIVGALNVSCADCISRKRLTCGRATVGDMINGGDEAKAKYQKALSDEKVQLLVYDDSTTDFNSLSATHPLRVVINSLRKSGYDAYYLHGGVEAFSKKYGQMCSAGAEPNPKPLLYSPTNNALDSNIDTAVISKIMPQLYVGNERDAASEEVLKENGITHIMNVTSQIPLYFESNEQFVYKRLPASDSGSQNLKQYFDEALKFIDDAAAEGGRVLVHCQAGVSRSATIAIAYVMARLKMGMLDAFRFVKTRRPVVAPNFNFMGQLLEFESKLFGDKIPVQNCTGSEQESSVKEEHAVNCEGNSGGNVVNGLVRTTGTPDASTELSQTVKQKNSRKQKCCL